MQNIDNSQNGRIVIPQTVKHKRHFSRQCTTVILIQSAGTPSIKNRTSCEILNKLNRARLVLLRYELFDCALLHGDLRGVR